MTTEGESSWRSSLPDAVLRRVDRSSLPSSTSVLIVVATPAERAAMLRHFTSRDGVAGVPHASVGPETYFAGRCGAHDVALVMCEAGSTRPGASALAVRDAIEHWRPRAIVMVGIAFGRRDRGQEFGDVLVSEHLAPYELQRVGPTSNVQRASKPPADTTLVNRFRNATRWKFENAARTPTIHIGEILSGEKLVDEAEFVQGLFETFPHALGGEMEGVGLFAAAQRAHVPWILVKAVCDYGYEKTKVHQPLAAASAASLVAHVLNDSGMLDGLPGPAPAPSRNVSSSRSPTGSESDDVDITFDGMGKARFHGLCSLLARSGLPFAVRCAFGDLIATEAGREVEVLMHHLARPEDVIITALLCKYDLGTGEDAQRSIEASLNAWPSYYPPPKKWTLCASQEPDANLRAWFAAEMQRRNSDFDVWGPSHMRKLLVAAPAVLEVFFYRASRDVQDGFRVGDLELYAFEIDRGGGWAQGDEGVFMLARAKDGPSDLVLDVIVRNGSEREEVLTGIVALVHSVQPEPHGEPGISYLYRPELTYVLPLEGGTRGKRSMTCEPKLAIEGQRNGRIAIRLTETGYSWSGFVRVGLVFGKQILPLPYLRLYT